MLTRTLPLSLSNMFSPDHKCEMKRTMAVIVKMVFVLMEEMEKKVKITDACE